MICQFSFENYKAFKEESLLDFTAEGIGEYKDSIIEDSNKKEKVVPVIAVYGPNGGGKSTVLEALGFLRDTILRYIIITKMQDDDRYDIAMQKWLSAPSKDICYKLAPEYQEAPTKFDIIFLTSEKNSVISFQLKK